MSIKYCVKCFMPSTRPRMLLDENGVCSACTLRKREIDWTARKSEFFEALNKSSAKHEIYDCVVAWSGGKDSSAVALRLREEFNLNPLLVTFSPLIPTEEGWLNKRAINELGFDSIEITPNQNISRKLSKRFFIERGDPKLHWNAGINSAPIRIASTFGIPIIFYAEHGETEYGGKIISPNSEKERDIDEILENQIGDDPSNWANGEIAQKDLFDYKFPNNLGENDDLRALYFSYFSKWDVNENYDYIKNKIDFKINSRGRTYGTFSNYDSIDDHMDDLYYYMQYIKFGFGRCLRDAARQIQHNRMSREDAYFLIEKYDGEFPEETIEICMDYLELNQRDFWHIVDKHRSLEVWRKVGANWELRNPLVFPPDK